MKKRRFQIDISEELAVALTAACEHAAISKSEFGQRALLVAMRGYCAKHPEFAEQSLLSLLRQAEEHLLKQGLE